MRPVYNNIIIVVVEVVVIIIIVVAASVAGAPCDYNIIHDDGGRDSVMRSLRAAASAASALSSANMKRGTRAEKNKTPNIIIRRPRRVCRSLVTRALNDIGRAL